MPDSKDRTINYIEFPVTSVPEAKRFYGEAFGWTFVDYGPEYASFSDGKMDGGFRAEPAGGKIGGSLVILYAANLEAMEQTVKKAGGKIIQPIFAFPGGRRFHFTDPSGNELAVWGE
jgi:predicted enzyme related to lactoylglutathione lyase